MKKILLISYLPPSSEHAGGQRLIDIYAELKAMLPETYIALVTCGEYGGGCDLFNSIFNEVHCLSNTQFAAPIILSLPFETLNFDVIDLQYHQSGALIRAMRKRWPAAQLIFSPMESQLRALTIAIVQNWRVIWRKWRDILGLCITASQEITYVFTADRVVAVSKVDRNFLRYFNHKNAIVTLPTCLSPQLASSGFDREVSTDNLTIVFLAYFGSKTNQEALLWYIRSVHPFICQVLPNYRLRVVGHGIKPDLLKRCSSPQVDIWGAVDSIYTAFENTAIGISPALSGAGTRGKIHQYAAFGLPCVASTISCDGLEYRHGHSIIISNTAEDFSSACINLLRDKGLRDRVGKNARSICMSHYQWSKWRKEILSVYELNN